MTGSLVIPTSELDWLEQLRAEQETLTATRDRLSDRALALPGQVAAAEGDYRVAVRAAIDAGKKIPPAPDVLHPVRQQIEADETLEALAVAEETLSEFRDRAGSRLVERQADLEAAGEPLRELWLHVTEPQRRRADRQELYEAERHAHRELQDLRARFVREDEEWELMVARLGQGIGLPADYEPGDPVLPPDRPSERDAVKRRDEELAAVSAYEEARAALIRFDVDQRRGRVLVEAA